MHTRISIVAALAFSIVGCATATQKGELQAATALTPEHFASTATIKDDSLDTVATITTYNGYQQKHGLLGIVWNDGFLRAFIDKKSNETIFQLYQVIRYSGRGWNFYQTINFQTFAGPESKSATVVGRDVDCASAKCNYIEQLTVDIDEELLRELASQYQPNEPVAWKFKFNARSGKELNTGMFVSEIAGFLQAVDSYKTAHQ